MSSVADETRLISTYRIPPRSCSFSPPSTSSTNEALSITSKQTYKLNKSPATKDALTPMSSRLSSGKKPPHSCAAEISADA